MAVATLYPSLAVQAPRTQSSALLTYDLNVKELVDHEIPTEIFQLEKAVAQTPILALSSRMGAPKRYSQPVFYMFEIRLRQNFFKVTATAASTDATITVAAATVGNLLNGYRIVNLATREMMRINSTPDTAMPVERGVGSVAAAAVGATDEFIWLGYNSSEGDTTNFTDLTRTPTMRFNFIGEMQVVVGVTQIEDASRKVGGQNALGWARMDAVEQMRMNLEKRTIFDQRAKTYVSNKAVYMPNGLDALCTENEVDFGGAPDEATILEALEDAFRFGPRTRMVLISPTGLRKVNIALGLGTNGRRQDTEVVKMAGLAITKYQAPGGTVNFVPHVLFQDSTATDVNALQHSAFVMAMDSAENAQGFHYVTMSGSLNGWFRWIPDVHTPGTRGKQDQLVTSYGMSMPFAESMQRWLNLA